MKSIGRIISFIIFAAIFSVSPVHAALKTTPINFGIKPDASYVHTVDTTTALQWSVPISTAYQSFHSMDFLDNGTTGVLTLRNDALMEYRNAADGSVLWSFQVPLPSGSGWSLDFGDDSGSFAKVNIVQENGSSVRKLRNIDASGGRDFIIIFDRQLSASPYRFEAVVRMYQVGDTTASLVWEKNFTSYSYNSKAQFFRGFMVANTAGDSKYEIHYTTQSYIINGLGSYTKSGVVVLNADGSELATFDGKQVPEGDSESLASHIDTTKTYGELVLLGNEQYNSTSGNFLIFYQWNGSAYARKWALKMSSQEESNSGINYSSSFDNIYPRYVVSDLDGDGKEDFIVHLSSVPASGSWFGVIKYFSDITSFTELIQNPTITSERIYNMGGVPENSWVDGGLLVSKGRAGAGWQLLYYTTVDAGGGQYTKDFYAMDISRNMALPANRWTVLWHNTVTDSINMSDNKNIAFKTDYDGDGYNEVLYRNSYIWNGADGSEKFAMHYVAPGNDSSYAVVDLDSQSMGYLPVASGFRAVDMDGDGKVDMPLAWGKSENNLYNIRMQLYDLAKGSPKWELPYLGGGMATQPAMADLDNSGVFSIIFATHTSSSDLNGALSDMKYPAYNAFTQISSPTSFACTVLSTSSIQWTWAYSGATISTFTVFNGASGLAVSSEINSGTLTWTETGLSTATAYVRYVSAYSSSIGNGQWANSNAATCYTAAPNTPQVGAYGETTANAVGWAWVSTGAVTLNMLDENDTVKQANLPNQSHLWWESGLSPNTSYSRKIQAVNNLGSTTSVLFSTYTRAALPSFESNPAVFYTSATMNWSSGNPNEGYNPDGTKYKVYYSTVGFGQDELSTSTQTARTATLTGLFHGATYYLRVMAYNGAGFGTNSSTISFVTNTSDPVGSVSGLGGTALSSTTINWHWAPAANAVYYEVYDSSDSSVVATLGNTTQWSENNLSPNVEYGRYVAAFNYVSSATSVAVSTYTLPAPPSNLQFSEVSSNTFTFTWEANGNPLGTDYEGTLSTSSFFSPEISTTVRVQDQFTYTPSGVSTATPYYLRLTALNNASPQQYASDFVSGSTVTLDGDLGTFTHFAAVALSTGIIKWEWNDVANARSYIVHTSTDDSILVELPEHTTFWVEQGLSPNTSYERYISAYTNRQNTMSAPLARATLAEIPSGLSVPVDMVYRSSFTASWDANGNPAGTGYDLQYATAAFEFSPVIAHVYTVDLSTNVTGLSPETRYYVRVGAKNSEDIYTAGYSNVESRETASNPPGDIATFTATVLSSASVQLDWSAAARAGEYRIFTNDDILLKTVPASSTTWTDTELSPNTLYGWYVTAVNSQGISSHTAISTYTFSASPSGNAISNVYRSSFTASWNMNGNPLDTFYEIEYSTDSGFGVSLSTTVTRTTYAVINGLSYNTTYYTRVFSINAYGVKNMTPSNSTHTFTLDGPLLPLDGFAAVTLNTSSIRWDWNDAANERGYRVRVSTGDVLVSLPSGTTTWTETGLSPNISYSRYVEAYNNSDSTASVSIARYTDAAVPVGLSINALELYLSSFTVRWTGNSNPDGTDYVIEYSTDNFAGVISSQSVTAALYGTVTGLTGETRYYVRVRGVNHDGVQSAASSAISAETASNPPGAIATFVPTVLSSTSVKLDWSAAARAGEYRIYSSTGGNPLSVLPDYALDWTHSSLVPNTNYGWSVMAVNTQGYSSHSVVNAYTFAASPASMEIGAEIYRSSFTAFWNANGNPAGTAYDVEYSTDSGFYVAVTTTASVSTTTAVISGLAYNTTYYVRAFAVNSDGVKNVIPSNSVHATTLDGPLTSVTGFTAAMLSSASINWSWDNIGNARGYRVHASSDSSLLASLAVGTTQWAETGLSPNISYSRYVEAYNNSDSTASANLARYTGAAVPADVAIAPLELYRSSFTVRWTANGNPGATNYKIEYSTDSFVTTSSWSVTAALFGTVTGLTAETTYYVRVRGVNNSSVQTSPSSVLTVETASNPPGGITDFAPTVQSSGSVKLDWSAATRAGEYRIYSSTGALLQTVPSSSLTWTNTGLAPNTNYGWSVMAVNTQGYSSHTVVTANTFAVVPAGIVIGNIYRSSFTASWNASGNPSGTGYDVDVSTDSGFALVLTTTTRVSTTTLLVTGLTYNTTYYVRAFGVNADSIKSAASVVSTATTVDGPMPVFDSFAGTVLSSDSVRWTWNAVANVQYYEIYSSTDTGTPLVTLGSGATQWVETGFAPNTSYSRYAMAKNNSDSKTSNTAAKYTFAAVPGTPALTVLSRKSMRAAWTSANPSGTSYEVEYSTDSGFAVAVTTLASAGTALLYTITALEPDTTYYARVYALNGDSVLTAPSASSSEQTWALPSVTSLSVDVGSNTISSVTFTVNGSNFYAGDRVYITTTSDGGVALAATASRLVSSARLDPTMSLIGLNPGIWHIVVKDSDALASSTFAATEFEIVFTSVAAGGIAVSSTTSNTQLNITAANNSFALVVPAGVTQLANSLIYNSTNPLTSPIDVSTTQINNANGNVQGGYEQVSGSIREVSAYKGAQKITVSFAAVALYIYYSDVNGDGIVDGTNIQAINLRIAWMNPATERWEEVSGSVVDLANKRVSVNINHFSAYSLLGLTVMSDLASVKAYPNPWQPGTGGAHDRASMKFDNLAADTSIRIYNVAGELVRDLPSSSVGFVEWDGKNGDGKRVSSGVYFARLKSGGLDRIIKIAVER